jgi:hypothetical protein
VNAAYPLPRVGEPPGGVRIVVRVDDGRYGLSDR